LVGAGLSIDQAASDTWSLMGMQIAFLLRGMTLFEAENCEVKSSPAPHNQVVAGIHKLRTS
jgi:hypothetical protein